MPNYNHSIKLEAAFRNSYSLSLSQTWGPRISRVLENTNSAVLRSIAVGSSKPITAWNGGNRTTSPLRDFKLEVQNTKYETNFGISRDVWNRDDAGIYSAEASQLGIYLTDHWSKLVAAQLILNSNWYDSVSLFGSHPIGNSTQTNDLTATEISSLNVATATAPSADEAANIINEAIMYSTGVIVNDANVAVNGTAKKFMFITGSAKIAGAYRSAVYRQNLAQGSTSVVDGLLRNGYNVEVVMDNALASDTDGIYMAIEDMPQKSFILHSESAPLFEIVGNGQNDSTGFFQDQVFVGVSQSRSLAMGDYTKIYRLTHS